MWRNAAGTTMGVMAATRVLIAGGGVAALEAALALRRLAEERVSIDLVAPEPRFWYRPLAVLEPFGTRRLHGIDLAEIAEECRALFIVDTVAAVDPDLRLARTAAGAELEYDLLLLATGTKPVAAVPGALTFRGAADTRAFSTLLSELEGGSVERVLFALPGGVAWPLPLYELALQTAAFLDERRIAGTRLTIVTGEDAPLGLFGAAASAAVGELLARRRIDVRTGTYPVAFADGVLALTPGGSVAADRVVALPRLLGVRSQESPATRTGSSRPTRAAASWDSTTSSPPATSSRSPSSRAGSRRSRPTRPRNRSLRGPERRSSRGRSALCFAACSSPAARRHSCGRSSTAATARPRWRAPRRSGGRRARSSGATSPRSWPSGRGRSSRRPPWPRRCLSRSISPRRLAGDRERVAARLTKGAMLQMPRFCKAAIQ